LTKIVGSIPKTFPEILLFEALLGYRFERASPRLFASMALANLEQE
jgi:hypothetical protein